MHIPTIFIHTILIQLQRTEKKCRTCKQRLGSKQNNTATTTTTINREVHEIQDDVEGLRYMIQEVTRSIDTAARNPSRFKLTDAEIQDRRQWIDSVNTRIETLSSQVWHMMNTHGGSSVVVHSPHDDFVEGEMSQQEHLIARQDQELDVLGEHVLRIGELGRDMGQELDAQGQLLEDFGYEMQGTQTRLAAAQRKVQYVLDRAGTRGQLLIIGVLIVVLVILIFMVLD